MKNNARDIVLIISIGNEASVQLLCINMPAFTWLILVTAISACLAAGLTRVKRADDDPEKSEVETPEEVAEAEEEGVVVTTTLGAVRGVEFQNAVNDDIYIAFLGIPFAEPPIGDLRFMPPKPKEPWEGILDATQEAEKCLQIDPIRQGPIGSEDCLKLNIFTPKYPDEVEDSPLPVLVYIHGGGFIGGSYSMETGPDYLMTQDIIVVTLKYRLAAFGFLSFEDDVVSGNAGMKDQVLGLKWIRENILPFGGNPNKVTIFGFSAGAASVHMHMLSPLSRGLFHGVIAASGSAIAAWAFNRKPGVAASILADVYNCSREGNVAVLKCLQAADANEFALAQYNAYPFEIFSEVFLNYVPCIEAKSVKGAFLSDDPFEMLVRGEVADVPIIMGVTESECGLVKTMLSLSMAPLKLRKQGLKIIADNIMMTNPKHKPYAATKRMMDSAFDYYFKGETPSLDNLDALVKFCSDVTFELPMYDSVTLLLRHRKSPIFEYLVTIDTNYSTVSHTVFFASPEGVTHSDFTYSYIFYNSRNEVNPEHEGHKMAMRSVEMWANFARTGNPTPDEPLGVQWLPSEMKHRYYLNMGQKFVLEENIHHERMQFWINIRIPDNLAV